MKRSFKDKFCVFGKLSIKPLKTKARGRINLQVKSLVELFCHPRLLLYLLLPCCADVGTPFSIMDGAHPEKKTFFQKCGMIPEMCNLSTILMVNVRHTHVYMYTR